MEERFLRQNGLIGEENTRKLERARVALIGLGGVGGACAEALVRCGVGHLLFMDGDVFSASNLNRQLLCTEENLGRSKAEEAKKRALAVRRDCEVLAYTEWLDESTLERLDAFAPDYVIDAVDRVTSKLLIIRYCRERGIPHVSCMGTGNRLDASAFRTGTAADTAGCGCPLAKVMRHELARIGALDTPVVYSAEFPVKTGDRTPMSISFVPPAAGFLLAGQAVRTLLGL